MTNRKITANTHHSSRVLVALAALAMMASLLVAAVARPSYAAPSTFIVNLTADTPDANLSNTVCDVNTTVSGNQCTLRAAIQEANDNLNPTEQDLIRYSTSPTL